MIRINLDLVMAQKSSRKLTPLFIQKLNPTELRHNKMAAYLYIANIFSDNCQNLILVALTAIGLTEWNRILTVKIIGKKEK